MRNGRVVLIVVLFTLGTVSGCFGNDEDSTSEELINPFLFENDVPITTYYHFANATNASTSYILNGSSVLTGNNTPFFTHGTYYSTGYGTFEPTVGVTNSGSIFMTCIDCGSGTHIIRSLDNGQSWEDMGPTVTVPILGIDTGVEQVPNTNDPYLYVDLWTDRLFKFDMHALVGMTIEKSDNEGDTWTPPTVVSGPAVQDHQTIASSPYPAYGYDTTYVFCINGGYPFPMCSSSFDGGVTWTVEVPGAPIDCESGGLTGHIVGSNNGNFYRGNPGCDGTGYSAYKSEDGGFTWTEHKLPTSSTGTADTWNFEELAIATDEDNNIHALWMGSNNLPYYSYSNDLGGSWSNPIMIAPPGVNGTGFPTIAAGSSGRVSMGYIGTTGDGNWHGFMSTLTDSFSENPLITTISVNSFDDPLENEKDDCGYDRCGGFGDFIDIVIDSKGRPWFGLAHNAACAGDKAAENTKNGQCSYGVGIFGTFAEGPSLRGELEQLPSLPIGGPSTLPQN